VSEFRQNDLNLALGHYRRALKLAPTPEARAGALARIGRTLFKLRKFDEGLESYRAILTLSPDTLDAHGLPYRVIALSQIHDGLEAVGRADERDP
jgi:tetratricopeptide (TPR) repeat protein